MLEEPVLPVGSEVCDICGTTFEDDYQLNQVSVYIVKSGTGLTVAAQGRTSCLVAILQSL
jgi:hypothetical protein